MIRKEICNVILIFIFLIGIIVKSQKSEGEVIYSQITQLPKIKNAIGHLYFNKKNSLYTIDNEKENTSIQHSQNGSIIYPSNSVDSIANKTRFIFFNKSLNLFYNNVINSDTETILKSSENIIWEISKEYKEIINHRCQKAETIFYGKKYIAWFTKDITLNYGPLKINGLPGLILEVNTEDGKLKLKAEKIIFENTTKIIDEYSHKYNFTKAITSENYKDVLKQQQTDFENKINLNLKKGEKPIKFGDINCKDCNENKD